MIGKLVSHYRILRQLGAGGMGIVYLAEDLRLKRHAALKFLPPATAHQRDARTRFQREAEAASRLDHPSIATIFEIGDWEGQPFIAMAYCDGETLHKMLRSGQVSLPRIASLGFQIAAGVAAAHAAGVVHRDLKPGNVMVGREGQAKILDFGLARMMSADVATETRLTQAGTPMGTFAYLPPEVVSGADADHRADVWALGAILYEMVTGRPPFVADQPAALLAAILENEPPPARNLRSDVPNDLAMLIEEMLVKAPARRTITAAAVASRLESLRTTLSSLGVAQPATPVWHRLTRPRVFVPAVLVIGAAVAVGARAWIAERSRDWAAQEAIPQIVRMIEEEEYVDAFRLAQQAATYLGNDRVLEPLWERLSRPVTVQSNPQGATVQIKSYGAPDSEAIDLGVTPRSDVRIPRGLLQWRVRKAGFVTTDDVILPAAEPTVEFTLEPIDSAMPRMVRVSAAGRPFAMFIPGLNHLPPVTVLDYWIDQHEVTNREFKHFVDAGGYQRRDLWRHEFVQAGRRLSWEEAQSLLRDATGRPGPANWEQGRYPEGQEDYPVTGVSWYEANAYAAFAGKVLPSIYHWSLAAEQRLGAPVLSKANFLGRGATPVGRSQAMTRFGTYDMAGNVKEWCWNATDGGKRYILGGAWDEPEYMAIDPDARSPLDRGANFGFRTVKLSLQSELDDVAAAPIPYPLRDFAHERPVTDEVFAAYTRLFGYDRTPLAATAPATNTSNPDWTVEKVTIAAAYGNEKMALFLFLPKSARPPYQTVVYLPGAAALRQTSSDRDIDPRGFDFIIRSRRAFLYPIYKSTYERRDHVNNGFPNATNDYRDHVVAWAKDLGRALDYLETREDIQHDRVAYFGVSWGGILGPILAALEPRLKAAVFVSGGLALQRSLPEVDQVNFAPRVRIPVLMLNGRYDFYFPVEASQRPLFDALRLAEPLKRWILFDSGHNLPRNGLIKETLDWLDKHLGPAT